MISPVFWRDDISDAPHEGVVVVVCALTAASITEPTQRDLAEAPARNPARARFFERRALTRRVVAARLGIDPQSVTIGHAPSGAPVILSPRGALLVSISGRDDCCAVAIAPCAVGVDIEPIDDAAEPPWNVLSDGERLALGALDGGARAEAFLRLWTGKEAYLKALGKGLAREPREIKILPANNAAFFLRDRGALVSCVAEQRRISLGGRDVIASLVVLTDAP
jgi:phosphopantetheinyl transferase